MRRVLAVMGFLVLAGGCEHEPPPPVEDQAIRPARIFIVSAEGETVVHEFVGRVEAAQTVDMSFEVGGPMTRLPVREGQSVGAGTLLAALDPTDFQLAAREAEVQLKLARQDLDRKQKLLAERGISQSLVDDAQALFDLRQVSLAKARQDLADTRLYAPFDAFVARRFTDNYVNVQPGDPILRLHDLNELYVIANVPESLAATVTEDRVVGIEARFPFLPDRQFELAYRENTGEADAVAQTFEVTFAMPRPEGLNILPGMTATVSLELSRADPARQDIRIPTSALVADADRSFFVWVFDPETQLVEKRPVQVGAVDDRGIQVHSGLRSGELIVASGATHLQSGMRVRVLGEPVANL
jgi:RND family efflux transporter MFP subunit